MMSISLVSIEAQKVFNSFTDQQLESFLSIFLQDVWVQSGESEEQYEIDLIRLIEKKLMITDLFSFFRASTTRTILLSELQELQASLEDLTDDDLLSCRKSLLERVNECLSIAGETDNDNT